MELDQFEAKSVVLWDRLRKVIEARFSRRHEMERMRRADAKSLYEDKLRQRAASRAGAKARREWEVKNGARMLRIWA